MTLVIRAHVDLGLFDGWYDSHLYNQSASVRQFADRLAIRLAVAYPTADVDVTHDTRTSGGGRETVETSDGREADGVDVDAVRAIVGRLFEDAAAWLAMRDERNA
jgi:hypothetical protein